VAKPLTLRATGQGGVVVERRETEGVGVKLWVLVYLDGDLAILCGTQTIQ